jgi:hypothetical protein
MRRSLPGFGMHRLLLVALAACSLPGKLGDTGAELDLDGDGVSIAGGDCDDDNAEIYPGATERCDGFDNDCDYEIDESLRGVWFGDADGDGYGDVSDASYECDGTGGAVDNAEDCDDADADIHPGVPDVCDQVDNDCDLSVDEDPELSWHLDADGDGFGDPETALASCEPIDGRLADGSDCDDTSAAAAPGLVEICDSLDNDCDGAVDEDDADGAPTWYLDRDGDGYGTPDGSVVACSPPEGYGQGLADCDDADTRVHPEADELCDGLDNDCDAATTEDDSVDADLWYADSDGDGFGDRADVSASCDPMSGRVLDDTDCDDASAENNTDADEVCDDVDNDCDGDIDEDVATALLPYWYLDADADGWGSATGFARACDAPAGYAATDSDCDDTEDQTNPGADEQCDEVDNNCDGVNNETGAVGSRSYYADSDGDGYGDLSTTMLGCAEPTGYISDFTDCDDTDAAISPAATEDCDDGVDNDCDGTVDTACPIEHCGTISADETWAAADAHWVTCTVYVEHSSSPTLTIEDGAVVEFDPGTALHIGRSYAGALAADGSASGITLTSSEASPAAGDWTGLRYRRRSLLAELTGVTIEYAGYGGEACLSATSTALTVADSTVQHCLDDGISIDSASTLDMSGTTVQHAGDVGVVILGALDDTLGPTFVGNTLTDNGTRPIALPMTSIHQLDSSSSFTGNAEDWIELSGGDVTVAATEARLLDADYVVSDNVRVGDGPGWLEVEPGVTFYNDPTVAWTVGFSGAGAIFAEGTSTAPITWTSSEAAPAAGDWDGIYVYYTWGSDTTLSNVVVEYGGDSLSGNVHCWASAFTITDSVLRYSAAYGLYLDGCGSATVSGITYTGNTLGDTN